MTTNYIPGPNNEIIPEALPDTSSRFPIIADYATVAGIATSSLNSISASYAVSASYAP